MLGLGPSANFSNRMFAPPTQGGYEQVQQPNPTPAPQQGGISTRPRFGMPGMNRQPFNPRTGYSMPGQRGMGMNMGMNTGFARPGGTVQGPTAYNPNGGVFGPYALSNPENPEYNPRIRF